VVKACNNLLPTSLLTLARPAGAPDRSALPIAGDDPAAKAQVAELLDALGYDTVDVGTLADSWRFEPGSPVYLQPYLPGQPPQGASLEQYRRWAMETPSVPVPAARVRELIDSAVRGPAGGIRRSPPRTETTVPRLADAGSGDDEPGRTGQPARRLWF